MTRLQSELQRLFPRPDAAAPDAVGPVHVLVLGLARPADWELLSRVWQGVQADLGLPAPAIAVSGIDGYQLWFSLAQPVDRPQALAFLHGLRQRYWAEVPARRISQWPAAEPAEQALPPDEFAWPGRERRPDQWSAFVSPDLAPVFAETPWLDIAPVDDGQAQLLRELSAITPAAWAAALAELVPAQAAPAPAAAHVATAGTASATAAAPGQRDPRQFLLEVMNDPAVDLALRIEAAKALVLAQAPTVTG